MKLFLILAAALVGLTGCGTIASSVNYTMGTQALGEGRYDEAVSKLEKAVELDPDMGRNHTNLAAAYGVSGDLEKHWIHCRKATLCKYPCPLMKLEFPSICEPKLAKNGLKKEGTPYSLLVQDLGEPDRISYDANKKMICCQYGLLVFMLKDEKVNSAFYLKGA